MSNKWNGWINIQAQVFIVHFVICLSKCSNSNSIAIAVCAWKLITIFPCRFYLMQFYRMPFRLRAATFSWMKTYFFLSLFSHFWLLIPLRNIRDFFLMTIWNCRIFYGYFEWVNGRKNRRSSWSSVSWRWKELRPFVCLSAAIPCSVFFPCVSAGARIAFISEWKFISMRFFPLWIFEAAHSYTMAEKKNTARFAHSFAAFCSISYLEHLTSAPMRFNCTHCTDAAFVGSKLLSKKYLDN